MEFHRDPHAQAQLAQSQEGLSGHQQPDRPDPEDIRVEPLLLRLHGVSDVASFWWVLQSILYELVPAVAADGGGRRCDFDARQMALLHRLHPHLQAVLQRLAGQGTPATDHRIAGLLAGTSGSFLLRESLGRLTRAERELVELLCEGFSNREIAERRDKSVRTVKTQLTSVYKKLGVKSRSKLLALMR